LFIAGFLATGAGRASSVVVELGSRIRNSAGPSTHSSDWAAEFCGEPAQLAAADRWAGLPEQPGRVSDEDSTAADRGPSTHSSSSSGCSGIVAGHRGDAETSRGNRRRGEGGGGAEPAETSDVVARSAGSRDIDDVDALRCTGV